MSVDEYVPNPAGLNRRQRRALAKLQHQQPPDLGQRVKALELAMERLVRNNNEIVKVLVEKGLAQIKSEGGVIVPPPSGGLVKPG